MERFDRFYRRHLARRLSMDTYTQFFDRHWVSSGTIGAAILGFLAYGYSQTRGPTWGTVFFASTSGLWVLGMSFRAATARDLHSPGIDDSDPAQDQVSAGKDQDALNRREPHEPKADRDRY
jgi:hypothetical protein